MNLDKFKCPEIDLEKVEKANEFFDQEKIKRFENFQLQDDGSVPILSEYVGGQKRANGLLKEYFEHVCYFSTSEALRIEDIETHS